jgi:hypothetical protein
MEVQHDGTDIATKSELNHQKQINGIENAIRTLLNLPGRIPWQLATLK